MPTGLDYSAQNFESPSSFSNDALNTERLANNTLNLSITPALRSASTEVVEAFASVAVVTSGFRNADISGGSGGGTVRVVVSKFYQGFE